MRSDWPKAKAVSETYAKRLCTIQGPTGMSKSMNWLLTTNETHIEIITFITLGKNLRSIVHKLPEIWDVPLLCVPEL